MSGLLTGLVAVFAAGIAAPGIEHVSPGSVTPLFSIAWSGDSSCQPTGDVIEGLRRYIGADPAALLDKPLVVHADVESVPNGWQLTLAAEGLHDAKRELTLTSCGDVAVAMSLVLSLWIQATTSSPASVSSAAESKLDSLQSKIPEFGETSAELSAVRSPASAALVTVRRFGWESVAKHRFRVHLALGPVALWGPLPRLGMGALGRVGASYDTWRCDLTLLWLNSQRQLSVIYPSLAGEFGLTAVGIRAAYAWTVVEGLNVQPGVWSMVGKLSASSLGMVARSTPADGDWGAFGLGLESEIRVGALKLSLGGGCGLPFGRPRYHLGSELLYRTAPVAAYAQLLAGVAFP